MSLLLLFSAFEDAALGVPVISTAPVISGDVTIGDSIFNTYLNCSTGVWSGEAPTSYAYQWQVDSGGGYANISGATTSSFMLTSDYEGASFRCLVTATNSFGASSPATSNALGPVVEVFETVSNDLAAVLVRLK